MGRSPRLPACRGTASSRQGGPEARRSRSSSPRDGLERSRAFHHRSRSRRSARGPSPAAGPGQTLRHRALRTALQDVARDSRRQTLPAPSRPAAPPVAQPPQITVVTRRPAIGALPAGVAAVAPSSGGLRPAAIGAAPMRRPGLGPAAPIPATPRQPAATAGPTSVAASRTTRTAGPAASANWATAVSLSPSSSPESLRRLPRVDPGAASRTERPRTPRSSSFVPGQPPPLATRPRRTAGSARPGARDPLAPRAASRTRPSAPPAAAGPGLSGGRSSPSRGQASPSVSAHGVPPVLATTSKAAPCKPPSAGAVSEPVVPAARGIIPAGARLLEGAVSSVLGSRART